MAPPTYIAVEFLRAKRKYLSSGISWPLISHDWGSQFYLTVAIMDNHS
jgi:hypothetical protein